MSRDADGRMALMRAHRIPNLLTALRIVLAVTYPFVPESGRIAVLVIALITEYLDGAIARHYGWNTRLGRMLDPIADKLLFIVVAATFLVEGRLSWFALLALGVRDLAVAGAALLLLLGKGSGMVLRMRPQILGKITTVIQYAAFFTLVFGYELPEWVVTVALIVGAAAAVQYLVSFIRRERRRKIPPSAETA